MNAHVQFVFHRLFLRRKALLIYPMLSYGHWWQRKNAHKLKLNLAKIFHMRIFSNNFFFIVVLICVIGKTESSISQSSMTNIIVVVSSKGQCFRFRHLFDISLLHIHLYGGIVDHHFLIIVSSSSSYFPYSTSSWCRCIACILQQEIVK
jgi:hypothetical protein